MEKTANIILILLFVIILLCICTPIIFVYGLVSKICIFIGIIAIIVMSGFINYVTYTCNKDEKKN